MTKGMFIAIEGIDGSGKTSIRNRIVEWFKESQIPYCRTREPGGTPNAERLRDFVLFNNEQSPYGGHNSQEGLTPMTQALVINAARRQHVEFVIKPHIAAGEVVISDRFLDSTLAYQGAGMGLDIGVLLGLHKLAIGNFYPDLTILLDVDTEIAAKRVSDRPEKKNLLDEMGADFYERGRQCFLQSSQASDREYLIVDASQSEDQVFAQILPRLMEIKNTYRQRPTS